MFDIKQAVYTAETQIRPYIRTTPLDYSLPLSAMTNSRVYLKCEHLQYTGAFKLRGAFNKLLSLDASQKQQGIVTASSGNHGAAVALGLKTLEIPGIIFVPENVSPTKAANIRNYSNSLQFYGTDCMHTEMHAIAYAQQNNMVYISPYNDHQIIAGQGTIALELSQQLKTIDALFVPVGGGGLIAGIAGFIKAVSPKTQIFGCLPEHSPVMAESIKAGKILEMETRPTLSEATAGGIEPNAITFDLCKQYVDDYFLVSEQEIKQAILTLIQTHHQLIEGASAVALAALLKNTSQFEGKNVVVILSGANISLDILKTAICF